MLLMYLAAIHMTLFFFLLATCQQPSRHERNTGQEQVCERADSLLQAFEREEFPVQSQLKEAGGRAISLPSGKEIVQSELDWAAEPLIAIGPKAVPCLIPWVNHEYSFMRYIAIKALEEITGIRPAPNYFDETVEQQVREQAIERWHAWYEQHSE